MPCTCASAPVTTKARVREGSNRCHDCLCVCKAATHPLKQRSADCVLTRSSIRSMLQRSKHSTAQHSRAFTFWDAGRGATVHSSSGTSTPWARRVVRYTQEGEAEVADAEEKLVLERMWIQSCRISTTGPEATTCGWVRERTGTVGARPSDCVAHVQGKKCRYEEDNRCE